MDILVETRSVGVLVLLDDGHDQGDEFGPEVQVLDAGPLLLGGDHPLLGLGGGGGTQGKEHQGPWKPSP